MLIKWLYIVFLQSKIVSYPIRIIHESCVPQLNDSTNFHTSIKNRPPRYPELKLTAPLEQ